MGAAVKRRSSGYGRFVGPVAGAAFVGGALAAAGEHILGAAAGAGGFGGEPRFFYQLLFGAEALWLALVAVVIFAAGASAYYAWAARRGPVRLASPAALVISVALCGVAAAYFLATAEYPYVVARPRVTKALTAALYGGVGVAWVGAAAAFYRLGRKVRRRIAPAGAYGVAALRVLAAAALIAFVAREMWALWRAREAAPSRPDVYVAVMDAFRADRLEAYGAARSLAPALDEFGRRAVVFREAYTVSSWTKPAVASLFVSAYPGTHGVNARFSSLPPAAVTLAAVMREQGYRTVAVSANLNVAREVGMGTGFDVFDGAYGSSVLAAAGPPSVLARVLVVAKRELRFLGPLWRPTVDGVDLNVRLAFWKRLAAGRPGFFYVHYMEPHTPNYPRPEYLNQLRPYLEKVDEQRARALAAGHFFYGEIVRDPTFRPDYSAEELALAEALYDAEIRRMDVVMGRLFEDVIYNPGGPPEPIVIVTADHGEEFLEHGRWLHGAGLHREVADVPLLLAAPACRAGSIGGKVNLADVAPTIVSLAGGSIPATWVGLDLTPFINDGGPVRRRALILEGIQVIEPAEGSRAEVRLELNALAADGYYYVRDENAATEFLYDRVRDPAQLHNLAADEELSRPGGFLAERRDTLGRLRRRARARALAAGEVKIAPSLERSMKALGYVN